MMASYSWPRPIPFNFYFLVACLSSCGCLTLLSRLLKSTWGGDNLFGPNLGLGVGLVFFKLGLRIGLIWPDFWSELGMQCWSLLCSFSDQAPQACLKDVAAKASVRS